MKKIINGNWKAVISAFCAVVLLFSISAPSVSANKNVTQPELDNELLSPNSDFVKFLNGIEQLPPGIEKQGPEKVAKWLSKKTGVEVTTDGENLFIPSLAEVNLETDQSFNESSITTFGVWGCITAVGLMIGTVGFPFSKILKLKKAIDFLGGVTKTVKRINKSYKKYKSWNYRTKDAWKAAVNESARGLPKDTLNAFLDFFNISNVINQCT
ncbi:hypothetical protein [Lentibacillus juripiscarius]|uniref:Uncharacterized protein n=1 Tax=Lentibacillus juripiscarius TaxID=257446 RepID=A0ABW5V334_9BACI